MKRSPLKRKTPLKRGKRLTPLSKSKKTWVDLYQMRKSEAPLELECADCTAPWMKWNMEAHHPAGRMGVNILRFVWLCPPCHRAIHHKSKWARQTGRLLPEFEGRKSTAKTVNYFNV